jgi:hypothetical protein
MVWLSLGMTVAAIAGACAAGEDNSDVQVAAETNLPQCTPRPSAGEQKIPPDPTNGSRDVDNTGTVASGSSSGASSSGGATPDDCVNSSSSSSSSGSQ